MRIFKDYFNWEISKEGVGVGASGVKQDGVGASGAKQDGVGASGAKQDCVGDLSSQWPACPAGRQSLRGRRGQTQHQRDPIANKTKVILSNSVVDPVGSGTLLNLSLFMKFVL